MIEEELEGGTFTIEFTSGHPYSRNCYGKTWAKATQCVIKRNGFVIGIGKVVKHAQDKDDPKYARINSAKKAFKEAKNHFWKSERKQLWDKILNYE